MSTRVVAEPSTTAAAYTYQAGEQHPRSSGQHSCPRCDRQRYVMLVEDNGEHADQHQMYMQAQQSFSKAIRIDSRRRAAHARRFRCGGGRLLECAGRGRTHSHAPRSNLSLFGQQACAIPYAFSSGIKFPSLPAFDQADAITPPRRRGMVLLLAAGLRRDRQQTQHEFRSSRYDRNGKMV